MNNILCAYIDPWIIHKLCDGHPFGRLRLEEGPNQLFSCKQLFIY